MSTIETPIKKSGIFSFFLEFPSAKKMLLLLITLFPAATFAQNSLQSFFDKYSGRDGFTTVKISPKAFQLIASAETNDESMKVFTDITGLNVLVFDNGDHKSSEKAHQLVKEAYAAIGDGYDELISVKETGTDLKIVAKPAGDGFISDLIIVGEDHGEFVFVNMKGKIDLKKLGSLSNIDCKGMEHLEKMEKDK